MSAGARCRRKQVFFFFFFFFFFDRFARSAESDRQRFASRNDLDDPIEGPGFPVFRLSSYSDSLARRRS
jgi:hypothetical protein